MLSPGPLPLAHQAWTAARVTLVVPVELDSVVDLLPVELALVPLPVAPDLPRLEPVVDSPPLVVLLVPLVVHLAPLVVLEAVVSAPVKADSAVVAPVSTPEVLLADSAPEALDSTPEEPPVDSVLVALDLTPEALVPVVLDLAPAALVTTPEAVVLVARVLEDSKRSSEASTPTMTESLALASTKLPVKEVAELRLEAPLLPADHNSQAEQLAVARLQLAEAWASLTNPEAEQPREDAAALPQHRQKVVIKTTGREFAMDSLERVFNCELRSEDPTRTSNIVS